MAPNATIAEPIQSRTGQFGSIAGLRIPEPNAVDAYLSEFPELAPVIPVIVRELRQEFQTSAVTSLEVYRDPEIDDQYLALYVRMPNYPSNFMDRLNDISRRFDDPLESVDGYLQITTDFRSPEANDGI